MNRFELNTIQDIVEAVNEDNVDNFMVDFKGFLDGYIALRNISRLSIGDDEINIDHRVKVGSLVWIYDNENKINITLKAEEGDTIELNKNDDE
tara:strand:- start:183 stop:461 length:279 start_codon:yes stop_codon:yes gene_type:complete